MKARRKEIVESMRCWGFVRGFNKIKQRARKSNIFNILSKSVKIKNREMGKRWPVGCPLKES